MLFTYCCFFTASSEDISLLGRNEAGSHVLACDWLGFTYQFQGWLRGLLGIRYTEYHAVWWQLHLFFSNPYAFIFCAKLNWLKIQVQRCDEWWDRCLCLLSVSGDTPCTSFSTPVMSAGWLPLRLYEAGGARFYFQLCLVFWWMDAGLCQGHLLHFLNWYFPCVSQPANMMNCGDYFPKVNQV